jgi:hypothetical protein
MKLDTITDSPFELAREAIPAAQPILEAKKMDTHIVDAAPPASGLAYVPLRNDQAILAAAARWHEIHAKVVALDEESYEIWKKHLGDFDSLYGVDPRGASAGNCPAAVEAFGLARMTAFERACASTRYSGLRDDRELLSDIEDAILGEMIVAKPASLPARLARLRVLATRESANAAERDHDEWPEDLAESILEDVETLDEALFPTTSPVPSSPTGSFAALAREYIDFEMHPGPMTDEECDRGTKRLAEINEMLCAIPSITAGDVVSKLKVASVITWEPGFDHIGRFFGIVRIAIADAMRFVEKARDRQSGAAAPCGHEEGRLAPEWDKVLEAVENGEGDLPEMLAIIEYTHRAIKAHRRQPDRPEAPQGVTNCVAILHLATGSLLGLVDLAEMRKATVG